jgi:hypothetical protein
VPLKSSELPFPAGEAAARQAAPARDERPDLAGLYRQIGIAAVAAAALHRPAQAKRPRPTAADFTD